MTARPPRPVPQLRNPDVSAWLLECCTCGVWVGAATVREAVAWLQVHTHPDDRKATA